MKRFFLFALFALPLTIGGSVMKYISHKLFAVLLTLITLVPFSYAQTSPQASTTTTAKPQLFHVFVAHVKPEMLLEFESFVKNERNPLLMKGGVKTTSVWRPDLGDRFEYTLMRPIENFAELEEDPIRRALPREGNEFQEHYKKLRTFLLGSENLIVTSRPDLSYGSSKQHGTPPLIIVTKRWLTPFRTADYTNYLKYEVVPAHKKADVTLLVSNVMYGGDVNLFYLIAPLESYTSRDGKNPLRVALGDDAVTALNRATPVGTVVKTEQTILRYRADLSITPQTTTAEKK